MRREISRLLPDPFIVEGDSPDMQSIFFCQLHNTGFGEGTMFTKKIRIASNCEGDIINITTEIEEAVTQSGIKKGLVHVFVHHSTAALTTIEFEPGVLSDLKRALAVIAPDNCEYAHNSRWGDGNGRSHVKAAVVGPDITVPVEGGKLTSGTWQQIVLLELDTNAPRERTVTCTVLGD